MISSMVAGAGGTAIGGWAGVVEPECGGRGCEVLPASAFTSWLMSCCDTSEPDD